MAKQSTQVVIVGAGPTGLSLAVQLMRYGIDFIILEKNEHTTPYSKAIVVQARTMEIFREVGLAEKAISEGRVTTAMNIFNKGKVKASLDLAGLGNGISAFPYVLSLEQSRTEKLLAGHLSANQKEVLWGSTFTAYEENERGVTVKYSRAGEEHGIDALYVVGCDGAGSAVRHQMGLGFKGDTIPKLFYVTDVTLSSPVINKDQLYGFLIKKGFVLFFPMEGTGHYRVIGIWTAPMGDSELRFETIEGTVLEQINVPVSFNEVRWFSTYKVHSRKADAFRKGRCFIAGDAAHIHTPAGGQGMNTGIQDAYNLAWKLAASIKDNAGPFVLESYGTERMENAAHLLRTTDRMFDVMAGTNPFWNFIRLQVFPLVAGFTSRNLRFNKRIFPLVSQTGIAYPNSELTIKSLIGNVKGGDRVPYFLFKDGKDIFEYTMDPAFKLLFFGTPSNDLSNEVNAGCPLIKHSFTEIPKNIFGTAADFYILLRPDNHVAYIGNDINVCTQYFRKYRLNN